MLIDKTNEIKAKICDDLCLFASVNNQCHINQEQLNVRCENCIINHITKIKTDNEFCIGKKYYRIFVSDDCENCEQYQKNPCKTDKICQELADIYQGVSKKYHKNDDWSFMAATCPLIIEEAITTEEDEKYLERTLGYTTFYNRSEAENAKKAKETILRNLLK